MEVTVLRTENLTKSFGALVVTDRVNLTLATGDRHAVIGPNGAGKTSLINQLGGQLLPSSGSIYLRGQDVTTLPPERRCRMGIARSFQKNNLFRGLTVLENVRIAIEIRHGNPLNFYALVGNRTAILEKAEHVLVQLGLGESAQRRASDLSYGEQRQLEIAVALASEPEILLLDEPTSGMSPRETAHMIELIAKLPADLAVLLVEHDMDVVFSVANRITVLHYGSVLATGTRDEIANNPRVQEIYLGVEH